MPDTRLPDHWLGAPQFDGISAEAWRIFTHGYMWSNRYLSDGKIPLKSIHHLGTGIGSDALTELINEGLVAIDSEAIYLDWSFQTQAAEFKAKREENRQKAARHRANQKEQLETLKGSNQVRNLLQDQIGRRGEAKESDEVPNYMDSDDDLF